MTVEFIIRLFVAALMGGLIGYERELRGKEAGIRTHLLVAVGACLFMIISQYGFAGADRFDWRPAWWAAWVSWAAVSS